MKISIRMKFSLFLAVLLLLVVLLLSLLVLHGIRDNQQDQQEQYLARQANTANTYFIQRILSEDNKVPQTFLSRKGQEFAEQLEGIIGLPLVIYDMQGKPVSGNIAGTESESIKNTLAYALGNKTAYFQEASSIYYLTPLMISKEQVGVVQFYYSLSGYQEFYNDILKMFLYMGAGVFILSFFLGYVFFNSFATGIIKLDKMVEGIRHGHYETEILKRKDEIGTLSQGIHAMGGQIMLTIQGMEAEQDKLRLAVEKLSVLGKQQKQFIGNVTHEFKTPLTSIGAYIDLLEMYPDDDKLLNTAITTIKGETGRLYDMVDKVLQLQAMEKYDFELKLERLEVGQLLEAVLNSLKGRIEKFGLTLKTDLAEAYMNGDKDSLTMIVINLLDNAIKYNKADGEILVKTYVSNSRADSINTTRNENVTREFDSPVSFVNIEISDTGIGIPLELAHKIFEPFYTVDKNRSRENGGAGLGLSIAKKQAELMGGTIMLLETGANGTSFRITFPAIDQA